MVEAILSYVIKAIDESSSVMDRIKSSVGLLGSSLSELGGGFASVGSVMTGFAAGGVAGAAIARCRRTRKGASEIASKKQPAAKRSSRPLVLPSNDQGPHGPVSLTEPRKRSCQCKRQRPTATNNSQALLRGC